MLSAALGGDTPAEQAPDSEQEPNRTTTLQQINSSRIELIKKFLRDVSQQTSQDTVLSQKCRRSGLGFQRMNMSNIHPLGVNSLGPKSWYGDIGHRSTGKTLKTVLRQIYQHFLSALSGSTSGVTDFGSECWELSGALAEVGKVLTFKQKAGLIPSSELLTFTLNKW